MFPGITNGSEATDGYNDHEALNKRIEDMKIATKYFRETEF